MAGNIVKGICGCWIGILQESWSVGRKVGLRRMIADGCCQW
jgi:hypothetical protein